MRPAGGRAAGVSRARDDRMCKAKEVKARVRVGVSWAVTTLFRCRAAKNVECHLSCGC